jgi:hypothetical protein
MILEAQRFKASWPAGLLSSIGIGRSQMHLCFLALAAAFSIQKFVDYLFQKHTASARFEIAVISTTLIWYLF